MCNMSYPPLQVENDETSIQAMAATSSSAIVDDHPAPAESHFEDAQQPSDSDDSFGKAESAYTQKLLEDVDKAEATCSSNMHTGDF